MVWISGEGGAPWYPTRSVMTSPFTTDPAALKPRRLRSWIPREITTLALTPVAVGCGHAAFAHIPEDLVEQILVVRLADGQSWILHHPDDRRWFYGAPVAISCDELFAAVRVKNGDRLRRIRLDSLGPGIPPD